MVKVRSFKAEYGMSVELNGVWNKFYCGIELELENEDDTQDVKKKAWNTVVLEVEKQVEDAVRVLGNKK